MSRPTAGPAPYSDYWYALRYFDPTREIPVVIGASEAAATAGLSDYDTPLHVYLKKRRLLADVEQTERMENGKLFEPVILAIYAKQTGYTIKPCEAMLHAAGNPCLTATPDAVAWEGNGVAFVVDAKTTTIRNAAKWGEQGTDEIPDDYVIQGQHQMFVSDVDRCDMALLMDGVVRRYTIRRNEKLISGLVSSLNEMVERIVEGNPPDPTWRHPKTLDLMKELYGVNSALEVELSEEIHILWEKYRSLGKAISELEEDRKECQAEVLGAMGNAAIGRFPGVTEKVLSRKLVEVGPAWREGYSFARLSEKKTKEK